MFHRSIPFPFIPVPSDKMEWRCFSKHLHSTPVPSDKMEWSGDVLKNISLQNDCSISLHDERNIE